MTQAAKIKGCTMLKNVVKWKNLWWILYLSPTKIRNVLAPLPLTVPLTQEKISRYEFSTFQGAVYAIVVLGIQNCRVLFGPLPFEVCFFQLWVVSAMVWFALLVLILIYSLKFMFICIWKRMRDMNDNLIVRIFFRYMKKLLFWHLNDLSKVVTSNLNIS